MAAVILGWNPKGVNRWDYRAAVEQVTESGRVLLPRPWTPPVDGHTSLLDLVRPAAHAVGQ